MDFSFFSSEIPLILLCLNRDKTKGQFSKNATLIPTKTLPKKYDHFPINFQIDLFTYKLDFQNKNYIYIKIKKKTVFFLQNKATNKKKKTHRTREAHVMRLVSFKGFATAYELCATAQ